MKLSDFKKLIPERDQQRSVVELLELAGFVVFRANTGVGKYQNKDGSWRFVKFGICGFPDLFGYGAQYGIAIPFFCEVKRAGKKPTPIQQNFLDSAKADGCLCLWGTCEMIKEQLVKEGYL